jgi:FkbM family methyltransferase
MLISLLRRVFRKVKSVWHLRWNDWLQRRIEITCLCRDADVIPKVPGAGKTFSMNGRRVQRMHQGVVVPAGGYYGAWMTELIRRLKGHHEPQEELLFHHILKHCRDGTRIVEVGAFWAYYTAWFLKTVPNSRAVCLEPDALHAACGRDTLALNGLAANWVAGSVGEKHVPSVEVEQSDGTRVFQSVHSLASLLKVTAVGPVEVLHVDVQGAELPFLRSLADQGVQGLVRFIVVSTHHARYTGSSRTHEDCLATIRQLGGNVLAEHSVDESFSGDGLIVASFVQEDASIALPPISRNEPPNVLFSGESSRPFVSNAQNLEDIVLWRALQDIPNGQYIDIGASGPDFHSVSKAFYERGWRGTHFEPVAKVAAKLRAARPDEVVHEVALSDYSGHRTFFLSPIEGTTTGVSEYANPNATQVTIPVKTLCSFSQQWAGKDIHWMKIDVEGMEAEVLRGWDPGLLRPWVLVVEATSPNSREASHDAWEHIVLSAGYHFALFDGLNRFYVAEEKRDLLPVVAAPANVFDLMAGCRPESWYSFINRNEKRKP